MNGTKTGVCTVPVVAEFRIIDGNPVMVSAQYADIEAEQLLGFMLHRAGITIGKEAATDEP